MTVTHSITINDGDLFVHGRRIFSIVPDNIVLTHTPDITGAFIGASSSLNKSLHVFPVGVIKDLRFMCLFRFKLWWMTQRMGTCGKEVPLETQFMLIETPIESGTCQTMYTVLLPVLEGQFRAVLQGNERNEVEICLESGDLAVETDHGHHLVYIQAGSNPFELISQAVKSVELHSQTFLRRQNKKLPSFIDWFGWCTWDAFYTDVTAEGVEEGVKSLSQGGTPPKFLIIDDGWQQIEAKISSTTEAVVQEGAQFASKLTGIKENSKFNGLKLLVEDVKNNYNVKYVYVWHALAGYWGGVQPAAAGMEHYDSSLAYPVQSPGVMGNQPDIVMDSLSVHGLGLVHPTRVFNFYNELHAYLSSCGIDGVKVDVQNIIETLGAGHGGRVSLTRSYIHALEASVARNFHDNGCIACMCHNTDGLYNAKQTAVVRASDDFYPRDPASHTIHVSSVAYNTLFLGEFMQPDWDMFHSLHPAAEYHAAARAIGGCPLYVSDKPGHHNIDLLKRLVLPDGSVLRARLPGRPTRDCLFADPARDGISLLKIWNVNKCSGVVGVFNCQGAGWCKVEKRTRVHDACPGTLTSSVRAADVDCLEQIGGESWNGDVILYAYRSGEAVRLPEGASFPVTLKVLEYELFHVSPIKEVSEEISFAVIGLLHMFNCGGAVEELMDGKGSADSACDGSVKVGVRVRGCGMFGAYSSKRPMRCTIDDDWADFSYDVESGLLTLVLPLSLEEMHMCLVEFEW